MGFFFEQSASLWQKFNIKTFSSSLTNFKNVVGFAVSLNPQALSAEVRLKMTKKNMKKQNLSSVKGLSLFSALLSQKV